MNGVIEIDGPIDRSCRVLMQVLLMLTISRLLLFPLPAGSLARHGSQLDGKHTLRCLIA